MAETKEQREAREADEKADRARTRERQGQTAETGPAMSPEGVPYQSSGFEGSWRDEVNEGPFDEGEGKNSPLLKANQEAAAEREKELAETEKTYKTGRVSEPK